MMGTVDDNCLLVSTRDWPAVGKILEPVFRAGETYPHSQSITGAEARVAWVSGGQVRSKEVVNRSGGVVGLNLRGGVMGMEKVRLKLSLVAEELKS